MSIRTLTNTSGVYFITFTCYGWFHLIEIVNGYELFYKWFEILKQQNHHIVGFVVMPNHIHLLLYYNENGRSLNTIVGNGKRFLAYEIVRRLEATDFRFIKQQMKLAVEPNDKKRGKLNQVWEKSFDVKECRLEYFLLQKLNYIHNNPCTERWKLADTPINYIHSSASFYHSKDLHSDIVTHYKELSGW